MRLVDNTVVLIFWETSTPFSMVATPSYIPTNWSQGFQFFPIAANTCISYFYDSGHQTGMRWHPIVVLICIPPILSYVKDLSCAFGVFILFSTSIQVLWPFYSEVYVVVYVFIVYLYCCFGVIEICIFWILNSYQIYGLQIISAIP